MKRLLLVLTCGLLLAILGPAPAAARWWPFGHHSHSSAPGAAGGSAPHGRSSAGRKEKKQKTKKNKKDKASRASRHSGDGEHLYAVPRSIGRRHPQPGPAGAGAE